MSGSSYYFYLGITIGFVCFILLVIFLWRRGGKAKVSDNEHDIKLNDDHQLQTVSNTMIELRGSFEVNEVDNAQVSAYSK